MPTKDAHMDWAVHNRDFWNSIDLDNSGFQDWALSGMFYEAVHWVEAFLAVKGYHSGTHSERSRNMRSYRSELGSIQTDYDTLKQDSETARYDCYKHTGNEVRQLIPLADSIKSHISPSLL